MPSLRIIGEAQTTQARSEVARLTAQVEALNVAMAKTASIPAGGSPAGYTKTTAALSGAARAYNEALAASGQFRVENLKVNDVLAQQTDLLRRQKLGYKDIWGSAAARKRMQMIKREQLAMKNMTVRSVEGGIGDGHMRANLAIPAEVPKSWDNWRTSVGMAAMELQSANRVLLNWGKNTQWAGRQLMAGITYPIAALGAAAGVMAYQVDKEFTRIQKVYNTTADQFSKNAAEQMAAEKELARVREAGTETAMRSAREYGAAMTDTLAVQADLAATGQKGAALQGATAEVMKNAMLGEIDYQTTTKATIALQQQLHLSTAELGDQWAYLNAMENQTSLTMQDFATAIPIALGPLKQMGGTVQDLGTLLTAMVSRGVQVGKAANAIKATAQRLLRPSKQVQEEFRAITGADIVEIAGNNQGNMMGIMQDLYTVTKDLTEYDKSKAFAGLFGSYQLATMSAMVDGMGDLQNGMTETQSQVVMAQRVATDGAREWRRIQEAEVKRWQESVSGRFKSTLETVKASLADAGEPFLAVATKALQAVDWILEKFNSLSTKHKNILAGGLIGIAAVGPLIMLTGLFANLLANIGLLVSGALRLTTQFNLLNKAEWAQVKLDQLMQTEMYSTTSAMKAQTTQLQALTSAMQAHNQAMAMSPGYAGTAAGRALMNSVPTTPLQQNKAGAAQIAAGWYDPKKNAFRDPDTGRYMKAEAAQLKAKQQYYTQIAESQGMTTRQAFMENRARERTNNLLTGGNVAMGAMAASTVLMVQNTSDTGQNIGQWLMLLAIGVPAMKGLAGGAAALASNAKAAYGASLATSAAVAKTGGPMTRLSSMALRFSAGAKGAGAAFAGMMGPVGWTVAAIATMGFGLKKLIDHEKDITEEKRRQANAMYDQKNLLQDQLKIDTRDKKGLSITGQEYADAGLPNVKDLAEQMKDSDVYKPLIDELNSDALPIEKQATIMAKYRDILESTGGTAQKAQLYLEALFQASGDGALEAETKAADWVAAIGDSFDDSNIQALWRNQIASIFDDDLESVREQGAHIGKDLIDAIASSAEGGGQGVMDKFMSSFDSQYQRLLSEMSDESRKVLADVGIDTGEEIAALVARAQSRAPEDVKNLFSDLGIEEGTEEAARFQAVLNGLASPDGPWAQIGAAQGAIVQALVDELGITRNITDMKELQATWEWQLATAHKGNAKALYDQKVQTIGILGSSLGVSDAEKLRLANQILANAEMGRAETLTQALAMLAGTWQEKVAQVAPAAQRALGPMQRLLGSFTLENADFKSILQSGMEGVTTDLADAASETFDNRMNSAIDNAQDAWDRRIDEMNARHERVMEAFDNRWERRKDRVAAAYDAQIEGIDKAIEREEKAEELRERMFEAEMTRIERLKETANSNIDFNVALRTGDLDEAARIQNDMGARAQEWALGDARERGKNRSAAKIDALGASKDQIEEAKDKRLEALADLEEKQREHLQKMQEQEEKSLQERSENAMENMRNQWEAEKRNLNDKLDLFRAYTAKNKKDLDRWLGEVGLSYDDFGGSVMMKGETWSGAIQKSLKKHVREAGLEIANSSMWEQWAAKEAKSTLRGMGFGGMGQFKRFIMTGELPSGFGTRKNKNTDANTPTGIPANGTNVHAGGAQTVIHHQGGIIGKTASSRKGVARTLSGLHSSEVMVQAQKGEGILTRDAIAKYGSDVVDRMNKGQYEGGPTGPAGFLAGMATRGLISGVNKSFANAVQTKQNQMAAQSLMGIFTGTGALGNYNLPGVKPWVLEAANYLGGKFGIGTIGGVGDRAANPFSDHPRGLALDFMTNSVAVGNSLAAEALRIQKVLDATYMIWQGRIHSFDSRGWRPYSHPSGATDPTSMHMDHVHISFEPTGVTGDLPSLVNVGPGAGGRHAAADPGKGWTNSHDYANGLNSPLYAFNDSKVIESRAITSGGSPGNGLYKTPYRSYGETMVLQDAQGNKVRYAHLAPRGRFWNVGDTVPGGTRVGLSGMTGNASGPHTHFEFNGSYDAQGLFARYGIPLKTGAYIKRDNVPAVLHKDEQVVDKKRTKKLYDMVDNFATSNTWNWLSNAGASIGPNGMPIFKIEEPIPVTNETKPGTGGGNKVRTGTYNVHFESTNAETQKDLSKLFGMADVLSLTEFTKGKRALLPWIKKQGWGVEGATGGNESVVAYNRSKFSVGGSGVKGINSTEGRSLSGAIGKGGARRVSAAYALLQGNGMKFWQIAAHTIAHIWKDPRLNRKVQQEQFGNLASLGTRLSKGGKLPVFIGGDLNNDPRAMGGQRPGGEQGAKWFKAFTDAGFSTNWTKQFMASQQTTFGDRFIDHVMANSMAKLLNTRTVGGLSSDHRGVIAEYQIPQLAKGAQNIRWDNTLANLHKGESVLTEDLTRQFKQGVANFANGAGTEYNINVILNQADMSPEELAYKIQRVQQRAEARLGPRRTNR